MADVSMRILLSATGGGAVTSVINDIAGALGSGGLATALAGVGVVAVGAAAAIGVTAVSAAADFQSQTERLVTSAGELQSNLDMVRQGMLQMSIDTATSTQQLASGMYYVESSGYRAADALNVLKVAAEGAKSENADLDVVSKALTTVMTDYHMSADQASVAMNGLITAVQNGKTNLQDLSSSMGGVLPIASSLGISFQQVVGTMDALTNAGLSSHQAALDLSHVMLSLSAPSGVAVKSMKAVGLSAQEVKDAMVNQGLPEALQMIEDAIGKKFPKGSVEYETALKNITGGIMGFKLASMLTGDSLASAQAAIASATAAMGAGKGQVLGFAEVQSTFNFKIDQAKQAVQAFLITLGTGLLPMVGNIVSGVTPLIQRLTDWISNTKNLDAIHKALQPTLDAIAGVFKVLTTNIIPLIEHLVKGALASGGLQTAFGILATVIPKLIGFFQGFLTILANVANWFANNQAAFTLFKIVIIGIAIILGVVLAAALATVIIGMAAVAIAIAIVVGPILGIIWVVQHWGQIWSAVVGFVKTIWKDFTDWLGSTLGSIGQWFAGVWSTVTTAIKNFFTMIGDWIQARINDIVGFFKGLGQDAKNIWNGMIQGIQDAIHAGFQWVKDRIQDAINFVVGLFSWLYDHNYYFQALVDTIRTAIAAGITWLKGVWTEIVMWLTQLWQGIVHRATTLWNTVTSAIKTAVTTAWNWLVGVWNTVTTWLHNAWMTIAGVATTVWNAITGAISTAVQAVWNWLVGVWNTVIGWLSQQWNKLSGFATTAWNNVVGVFKGVWNSISGALGDLWNNISGWFGNLANQAIQWGKNLIQGFINGVKGMLGDVGKAMGDVAGTIGKFLGFHSPAKEGPGSEADVWAPNLIKMFAQGLTNALPTLQTSLALVMRPVGSTLSGQGMGAGALRSGPSNTYGGHTFNITISTNFAPTQQQAQQLAQTVQQEISRQFRNQTSGYAAGGIF